MPPTRALQEVIDTEVEQMLQMESFNKVLALGCRLSHGEKKDGSWKFCVDHQKLYLVTHRDAYSLPRIDSTLESLAGSKLLTTLNLTSG